MDLFRALRARRRCALALVSVALVSSAVVEAAAPRISGTPAASVVVGQVYRFKPTASDADGNPLTFSIAKKPDWASFSSKTGELVGTPFSNHTRTYSGVVISVRDGTSTVSLPAWSLVVKANPNRSPTISGTPASTARVGAAWSFQPTARDPEGKPLTFTIRNKPAWATFSASTGKLSGTPTATGTAALIMIVASDGVSSTALLPLFSIAISGSAAAATNTAPTISGTPAKTAIVGSPYRFVPTARDANNDALLFSIQNLPAWARLNAATGELAGTPTAAGTIGGIVITVRDSKGASMSLAPFSIVVSQGVTAPGAVALRWIPPTVNDDGTVLTDLAGYRIRYGRTAGSLSNVLTLNNPSLSRHVLEGLAAGTWHFSVTAFSAGGSESEGSPVLSTNVL
jgi:hypothetical protein